MRIIKRIGYVFANILLDIIGDIFLMICCILGLFGFWRVKEYWDNSKKEVENYERHD